MSFSVRAGVSLVCVVFASFAAAGAQELPAAAGQSPRSSAAGAPRGPRPAPTNIKALPKNISGDQLIALMREYTGDLGVECEFCHAQNAQTKRNEFASDVNPMKDTARYMITMTADLNDKYLSDLPGRRYGDPITCGTCHQGHSHPQVFVPAPRQAPPAAGAAPGAPPATH